MIHRIFPTLLVIKASIGLRRPTGPSRSMYMHLRTYTLGITLTAILTPLWVNSPVLAADTAEEMRSSRLRNGLYLGSRLTMGTLKYKSDTAESEIDLSALPTLAAGFDLWPDETFGLHGEIQFGTGAEIKGVFGQKVSLNAARFSAGARYRWFRGPRATDIAYALGLSVHGYYQFVQDQRPSVLLDRRVVGPRLSASSTVPIGKGGTWIRLTGYAELPFFVRETPNDSGDPTSFLGYGSILDAVIPVVGPWSLQLNVEYTQRIIDFDGPATRAGGTGNGQTQDRFLQMGLFVRRTDI